MSQEKFSLATTMEEVQVELISRETIKPSSPTPHHLRQFPLSLIDQLYPPVYTRMIFFYAANSVGAGDDAWDTFISRLKESLSQALAHFYPLAGRVRDNLYIECNDQGMSFSEARVTNSDMSGFLKQPSLETFNHLLPTSQGVTYDPASDGEAFQIHVQVNSFTCGGVAIGIALLHKVIDGTLISQFLKKWASFATTGDDRLKQEHTYDASHTPSSVVFPSRGSGLPSNAGAWAGKRSLGDNKLCVARFVFNAKAITALRDKSSSEKVPNPSAVEVLSGFIWKHMMTASKAKSGLNKSAVLAHLVNLRPKVEPPIPEDAVGNVIWKAISSYKSSPDCEAELPGLVGLLRKSFLDMKKDYVAKLKGEEGIEEVARWLDEVDKKYSDEDVEAYAFISFCRMGFNELDFGRGRPVWVSPGALYNAPFDRGVFLLDAKWGKERELEAWVHMEEERMEVLMQDHEFLAFATPNPSISILT